MSPSLLQTLDLWGGQTCWENSRRRLITPICLPPNWPRPPKSTMEDKLEASRGRQRCPVSRGWTTRSSITSTRYATPPKERKNLDALNVLAPSTWNARCCGTSGTNIKDGLCPTLAASVARSSSGPTIWRCICERFTKWPRSQEIKEANNLKGQAATRQAWWRRPWPIWPIPNLWPWSNVTPPLNT